MDHLFIINPAAGKKDSTETLERLLERLPFPRKIVHTAREGDARRMTEAAAALGKPIRIYACGGDGTLNEVVNGAAGHDFLAVTNVLVDGPYIEELRDLTLEFRGSSNQRIITLDSPEEAGR